MADDQEERVPFAGTLKVEIIKPVDADWEDVGPRMRALRHTVAPALTLTMRDLYQGAMLQLEAARTKSSSAKDLAWQGQVEKVLRERWNIELSRHSKYEADRAAAEKRASPDARTFLPVTEYLSAETRHHLLARFTGQPFKDLMASRVSIPSWKAGCAFYARSRECVVSGEPDQARLAFPLWGGGAKRTELVVAPCGHGHEALWRRLVAGELKLGRVGISRDDNRRKWYALISWTGEVDAPSGKGQHAVVHLGVNVFVQALADDGTTFRVDGQDILVTRKRMAHRMASLQRALDTMGKGSRGHGKQRRMRPLTRLEDKLSRYCETKNRQTAAALIAWCQRHGIGTLHLEDLSGTRDAFEKSTGGEAAEDVKRLIHSWPCYQLRCAIERQGKEHGVVVEAKSLAAVLAKSRTKKEPIRPTQDCPQCAHSAPGNVQEKRGRPEFIEHHGRMFSRSDKRTWFECEKCGFAADGDLLTCANYMVALGRSNPLQKAQRKARRAAQESLNEPVAAEE